MVDVRKSRPTLYDVQYAGQDETPFTEAAQSFPVRFMTLAAPLPELAVVEHTEKTPVLDVSQSLPADDGMDLESPSGATAEADLGEFSDDWMDESVANLMVPDKEMQEFATALAKGGAFYDAPDVEPEAPDTAPQAQPVPNHQASTTQLLAPLFWARDAHERALQEKTNEFNRVLREYNPRAAGRYGLESSVNLNIENSNNVRYTG